LRNLPTGSFDCTSLCSVPLRMPVGLLLTLGGLRKGLLCHSERVWRKTCIAASGQRSLS